MDIGLDVFQICILIFIISGFMVAQRVFHHLTAPEFPVWSWALAVDYILAGFICSLRGMNIFLIINNDLIILVSKMFAHDEFHLLEDD